MNKYTSQEEVRRTIIKDMVKKRNSIVPPALTAMKERGYYGLSLLSQYYYEQVAEILVDATKILQEELKREEKSNIKIDAEEHFDVFISYTSENRQTATAIFEVLKNMNVKAWFDERRNCEVTPSHPYWTKN